MEHKTHLVSIVFFVTLLCMFDFVKASKVTIGKTINEDGYSKVSYKKTELSASIEDRSSHKRRRFIQEDVCADIVGATWNMAKEGDSPCPKLTVWVPKKIGFRELVNVNDDSEVIGGFSVAIFCHALQLLPYNVQPIFLPYVNDKGESNGTYTQLVEHIEGKTCEAVAGDVTIRANRTKYADFTAPYLSSEVYMLVLSAHEWNQTLWTFLRPFTWRLWISIVGACIFTGVALAILEYRARNPKFSSPFYWQLIMVFWFPISTFFFNEGKILNSCSKVVLVVWLSTIFIIVQIFTATLSAWLTLDQLHPRLPSSYENAGYQDGSFLDEFIKQQYDTSGNNLVPLKTVEEYKNALSNGRVNAIFDELPYIDLFLAKYGSDYMKIGPIKQESGIGFAFPIGSRLLRDFTKAVINVTESEIMMAMMEEHLRLSTNISQPNQAHPQSLDVQSFIGLFILMGTVSIAAIISSEISLRRVSKKIHPHEVSMDKEQGSDAHHVLPPAHMGSYDLLTLEMQNKR